MFNRLGFRCTACGKELTGGLDTYGDVDVPLCQEHYFEHVRDDTASAHASMLRKRALNALAREERRLRSLIGDADALGEADIIFRQLDSLFAKREVLKREIRGVFVDRVGGS